MKICLLGDAISTHIRRLAAALAGRGHRVHVVSYKSGAVPGATVARFRVPPPGWRYPARWHRRRAMYLRRIFRGHDVVHLNFLHDWAITPEIAAAGRLIVTPWGSDIVRPPDLAVYPPDLVRMRRKLLRMADTVLVYGRSFARPVAEFAGLPLSAIHSVPLGVDTSRFTPRAVRPVGPPTVGFFKGFKAVYAPAVWVQAIPLVRDAVPDARFEMIGDGPLLCECQKLAYRLRCSDTIRWQGCLPNELMPDVISRWSVTVIPSVYESFCVAALESSAMEIPVVASRVGGLIETVKDRETGLLVPPNDPRALANAVIRILRDRSLAVHLGLNGRRFVRTRYEWSRCVDQLIDVYHFTREATRGASSGMIDARFPSRLQPRALKTATRPRTGFLEPRDGGIKGWRHHGIEGKRTATPPPVRIRSASNAAVHRCDGARSVLMVSAAFPPTGGPGVQRSTKFAKYLPHFDWTPVVWASQQLSGLPVDPSLLADVSDTAIIRPNTPGAGNRTGGRPSSNRRRRVRRMWRMLRHFGAPTPPFPDDCANWARHSVQPILELIAERRIDALYSTFSPASNHWLALELKRQTGLPWVADFRDLWTDDYRYRETSPSLRAAHRALQQEILETADVVIGVTEGQTAILADHVPSQRGKFVTLTNGFDPEDFEGLAAGPEKENESSPTDDPFILSHVGRFDRWRAIDAWFDGLTGFMRHLGPQQDRFVLRIVGHADTTTRGRLQDTGARCEFTGYVSHVQAIREMCHATALLLSVPDGPNAETVIPAKLFEYLAAGRPILVVGPPGGACDEIVDSYEGGPSVSFDGTRITTALADLVDRWTRGVLRTRRDHCRLEPFDRIVLTRRLAAILDDLVRSEPLLREQPSESHLEFVAR